jgi:hypothetical protein
MKVFNLIANAAPVCIAGPDDDLQNVRDVIVTNVGAGNGAGGGIATLQYDGSPNGSSSTLGTDVQLTPGVGDLLAVGAHTVIGGNRPGSRLGSWPVLACSVAATTLVVQIVKGTKTLP